MTLTAPAWMIGAALLGALASAGAHAQGPVTEREAATYIYGGFLTDAAHAILSKDVKLGPELRRRLALPPDADSRKIYETMTALTDWKPLVVRKAGPDELSRYAGNDLRQPLFALEAGDTTLLIQYDLQANNIPFVGQLAGPLQPVADRSAPAAAAEPPKAVVIQPEPPRPAAAAAPPPAPKPRAAAVQTPRPRAAVPATRPPAPSAEPLKPAGPCVVKPVMSNQDLVNCGATLR